MLQTIKNAWKLPDLRKKILFTLFILLVYRLGSMLPVPFVDSTVMNQIMESTQSNGGLFQYYSFLAGEAFSRANVFALSITPYITAQIVMQLLTIAIPPLERMAKEGDEGRKKISSITRYVTVGLAILTAYGYYTYLRSLSDNTGSVLLDHGFFPGLVIVSCYAAGAAIIMWLAEKINECGIGNGISIILFANIVSRFPTMISSAVRSVIAQINNTGAFVQQLIIFVLALVVALALMYFVVHMQGAERRIPVQYAKRQVGRRMYGGQNTYLPLRLNMTGVMPIIFASSIVALPSTIGMIFNKNSQSGGFWGGLLKIFSPGNPVYAILTFILIILFSYFYVSISFNPIEVANNLKKNGGSILGIRPGKPTSDYITRILSKITLIGAIFLGIVSVIPMFASMAGSSFAYLAFGGSSIIIIVGVIIETVTEIETQMTMRHYKGFLE